MVLYNLADTYFVGMLNDPVQRKSPVPYIGAGSGSNQEKPALQSGVHSFKYVLLIQHQTNGIFIIKTQLFEEMPVPRAVVKLAVPTTISCLVMVLYNLGRKGCPNPFQGGPKAGP